MRCVANSVVMSTIAGSCVKDPFMVATSPTNVGNAIHQINDLAEMKSNTLTLAQA